MLFLLLFVCAFLLQFVSSSPVASPTISTISSNSTPFAVASTSASDACTDISICRTRYTIIWSSLVTILACVWTAVHRNVPAPEEPGESQVLRIVGKVWEAVRIVVVTVLVPEWVLAWAVRQFLNARVVRDDLRVAGCVAEQWTVRHGFFVAMGGFNYYMDGKPRHPLSHTEVVCLIGSGDLVPPTDEEIGNMSQGDVLSKTLAVVQTLWFVVQATARRIEGLPITQLEIMTLAYTVITVAMYVAWWDKPQNVGGPVRVPVKESPEPDEVEKEDDEKWYIRIFVVIAGAQDQFVDLRKERRVPTFYGGGDTDDNNSLYADILALCAAMVFGAVHCLAWNYAFPSHAEKIIWRVSSLAIVALPVAILVSMLLAMMISRPSHLLVFLISAPLYIAARSLLLALSFSTLRSLPPEAYRAVQWTLRIPHFT
ncbi:hypothetical protein BV25DRAFT_1889281 [Artomyces pyxidatus]|uniref:Uncharacterized protein n=1 Tax=Artomyces pyxidatus TaxID=48021 RepID=A0ACB8SUG2_9AGAM|nr:hypothetical protein BV25DRAFT_1889281 [Artomyces pyxidatus]